MMDTFKDWKQIFEENDIDPDWLLLGGAGGGDEPEAPAYQMPSWATGLPEEQLALIRAQQGKTVPIPAELDIASSALQGLLGISPEQFRFPLQDIQSALDAQQAQDLLRYQQQVNPLLAARGQFDSTTRENQLADFLSQQSTSRLGQTANLLTEQALRNFQLQQFIPQFQAGIAGQLAGLGGQRSALDQFNITLPFQTTIPALGNVYQQGLSLGDRETQQKNLQFQADLQSYLQEQQQKSQMYQQLGGLALAAATGGISGGLSMLGSGVGFGGGALQGIMGTAPTSLLYNQYPEMFGTGQVTPNYSYRPSQFNRQSQTLGFDTRAFS